jgi:hypothetical protein
MADVHFVVSVADDGAVVRIESRKEAKMAKDAKFTWLGETTWSRSYGPKAPSMLEKGKTYEAEGFPPEVLAEWVRTGHAKLSKAKEADNG